jgi:serine/threonine protein kinase/Flp pilus assembly protein TadD
MIGKTIHHYKILEELGTGGMGTVYKAQDIKLNRLVALKFLAPHLSRDEDEKKRFIHEARAISALDHPNICNIFNIEETDDRQIYLVMACYEGKSLKDIIKEERLPVEQAVEIALQIAEGLEAAHSKNIIHRDIKPANVLITEEGRVKIVDFGLAKLAGNTTLTKEGSTLGTIAYMSPEQSKGLEVDNRTDIWAFGVVLYEMLTGESPFKADYEQAVIYSILNEPPTPIENYNDKCPATLAKIVNRCLAKNPDERYQKISEVINDLQLSEVDTDYGFRTKTLKIRKQGWTKYNIKKIPAIIGLAIIVIALSFLLPGAWQKIKDFAGWNSVPEEQHMVILPLINIGGDSTKQAFCEGLMETLSSNITQVEQFRNSLWVVPSSEVIQGNIKSAGEAYKKFGVNLAVTGSVQFIGNLLKLNLYLIDAKDLRQLNSSIINVNIKDISSLDKKAVINLLEMLHLEVEPQLKDVLEAGKTDDPEAYEYYVQGIGRLQQFQDINNVEEAMRLLKLATLSDSNYALAYAGLGEAYWWYYDLTKNFGFVKLAEDAANKGYALDSTLASTNVALGIIYNGTGKYEEAVIHLKKALDSEPSDAAAYRELAKAYQYINRDADAEATFKRAIKLKPDYWAGHNDLGVFYFKLGRFNDAAEQFKEVIKCAPNNSRGYVNLGIMYYHLDQSSKAKDMFEKSIQLKPDYGIYSNLGVIYYKENNFDKSAGQILLLRNIIFRDRTRLQKEIIKRQ